DCLDGSGWTYAKKNGEIMKYRFDTSFNFSNHWAVAKLKNTTANEGWILVNSNGKIIETDGLEALSYVTDPLKLALMKDPKNFFLLPDTWFLEVKDLEKYLEISDKSVDSLNKSNEEIYNKKNCKIIKQAFRAKIESVRNPQKENPVWDEFKTQLNLQNDIKH
ncbi:MAG: hypothetical protein K2K31_00655, partial [Clostridia bacterium]|nr:hypothetical protein [Clostridia bacterium]